MVRLRTDRWYSADGQRRSRSRVAQQIVGSRRLLSLCFLLALVVVLMQKAADPRHVRNAFQALGVPLDDSQLSASPAVENLPVEQLTGASSEQPASSATEQAGAVVEHSAVPTAWEATCRDLVPRLLEGLTDSQLVELAQSWFAPAPLADVKIAEQQALHGHTASLLDALSNNTRRAAISEAEQAAWLQQIETFRTQWQLLGDQPNRHHLPSAVSPELQSAITNYVDRRLVAVLRDATPWTNAEMVPFWRLLQRGQERGGDELSPGVRVSMQTATSSPLSMPTVNTLQLAAEAEMLRGSAVRFRGSVRRVENIQRNYPPLGIEGGYWILWLRGQDEAVQPVAVYTTDKRAAELAKQLKRNSTEFPEIEVQAISAKRLAYASAAGVQVAPTLFASKLTISSLPAPALATTDSKDLMVQFLWVLLAACLLAAAIVIPITWQRRRGVTGKPRPRIVHSQPAQTVHGENGTKSGRMLVAVVCCAALLSLMSLVVSDLLLNTAWSQTASPDVSTAAGPPTATLATTPPWADNDQIDPLQVVFATNMQSLFDEAALTELREYQSNRTGQFPDSLLKALYAIRRIGWARAESLAEAIPLSDQTSLHTRTLSGWVRLASPVVLAESQQSWYQSQAEEQLYRVELQLQPDLFTGATPQVTGPAANADQTQDATQLVTVYCQQVPQAWLASPQLLQPAQFTTLAIEEIEGGGRPWCAVALRPAWLLPANLPTSQLAALLAPSLPEHTLALGRLGWDLSNIEIIANRHQQPLSGDEAAGFYSLIRIEGATRRPADVVVAPLDSPLETLSRAKQSVGQEITWLVRIVSGTLVAVDSPLHRRQLGADSYIQFDGFVDIGTDRIRFQPAQDSGQHGAELEFTGEFPVTIVSPRETSLVPQQQLAAGERNWSIGQYATLHGRFYRMWSYHSELVKSSGQDARQIAPLVIAARIEPTTPTIRGQTSEIGWFGWALCGSTLVILAGILWSAAGSLRKGKRTAVQR